MKYVLGFGGLAGLIAVTLITASIRLNWPDANHNLWSGYVILLLGLFLIFIGLKRYRDNEGGGRIGFGRAFALGSAMALVASLVYVLGWELYASVSGWDFISDFSAGTLRSMRAKGASAQLLQAKAAELRELGLQYRNPMFRLPMVFAELFPMALIVALVSAALLRNPRFLPSVR